MRTIEQWQELEAEAQDLIDRLLAEIQAEQRYTAQGEPRSWYVLLMRRAMRRLRRREAGRQAQERRDQALFNLRLIRDLAGDPTVHELVRGAIDLLAA